MSKQILIYKTIERVTVGCYFTFKLSLCLVKIKFQVEHKKGSWLLGGLYYSCKSGNLQSSHQDPRFIIHNFARFTRVASDPGQLNCVRQPKAHRGGNYPPGSRWINQSVPYSAVWLLFSNQVGAAICPTRVKLRTRNSRTDREWRESEREEENKSARELKGRNGRTMLGVEEGENLHHELVAGVSV